MVSFQLVWYWLSWQSNRSLCFGKMERQFAILLAVVLRCAGSLLAGTVVGGVYCMYVVGSFQLLVLFTGGVEVCSEEMTDNQGEL